MKKKFNDVYLAKASALAEKMSLEPQGNAGLSIQAKEGSLEILVYDQIGGYYGVEAKPVVSAIRGFKGKDISVRLNSPGGDVFAGLAIYNALADFEGQVNIFVDGMAASIASVIAMASTDKPVLGKGARLMIHNAWTFVAGDHNDMREMASVLESVSNDLAQIYSDFSGKDIEEVKAKMDAETYFSATEAEEFGLGVQAKEPEQKGETQKSRAQLGRTLLSLKLANIANKISQQ
jgi:ATP-dependent Clp endopeptidase proteolytic subunit ClpP